ncbi:MAG: hypothetical protein JXA54_16085 [Candidatus Heimdallarchaeota archaeon]|nr:hypothetical protein [Candidatus Heimdallarchaeota archaeon]
MRDTMLKILELRNLEYELKIACNEGCHSCLEKVRERINDLITAIGKDISESSQSLKNHELMIRIQELNALKNILCDLCHGSCGECKETIRNRIKELCFILERKCSDCPCK